MAYVYIYKYSLVLGSASVLQQNDLYCICSFCDFKNENRVTGTSGS